MQLLPTAVGPLAGKLTIAGSRRAASVSLQVVRSGCTATLGVLQLLEMDIPPQGVLMLLGADIPPAGGGLAAAEINYVTRMLKVEVPFGAQ